MLKILVTGALYNIVNILAQILLGLVVFREMLLHFGEADFGTWSLLFAILAHVGPIIGPHGAQYRLAHRSAQRRPLDAAIRTHCATWARRRRWLG